MIADSGTFDIWKDGVNLLSYSGDISLAPSANWESVSFFVAVHPNGSSFDHEMLVSDATSFWVDDFYLLDLSGSYNTDRLGDCTLEKWNTHYRGPSAYMRMLGVARLYLDNFAHVQASWFSEGKRAGQVALSWGADDFGGTLFEENVHAATGFWNRTTTVEIETLIRESGFTPAQRTTLYEILRVGEGPEALERLAADVPLFVESLRELPAGYPARLEGEESNGHPPGAPRAADGSPLVMPR